MSHNNQSNNEQVINNFIDLDIKEDLDESGDDVYNQIDNAKNLRKKQSNTRVTRRIESGLLSKRPISGRQMTDTSQFFTNFNKIAAFSQKELPFEDLFDRNERTLAATFV